MPIPYPEAFRSGRQEGREELAKKRLLSLQVVMLDWFCLGSPSVAPHSLRLGAKLTAKQWTAVEIIRHLGWDDNTPQFIEAEGMGRGAAKFEGYEDAINALHRALAFTEGRQSHYFGVYGTKPESVYPPASLSCGTVVGALPKVTVSPAKAIEADRIELPAPPAFNPVPLLDDATREVYESPLKTGVAKEDLGHSPVVHIRATKENKLELLKKLCQTGRLKPLHWSSVRKEHLSGLFAVPKSLTRDRLILDARPANQADTALNCWCKTMASAAILVDVVLTDEQVLVASGEDLRDFFYQFAVSQERTTRNALADPLSLQEALYVFGKDAIPADWTAPIFCGLSTLAMGDQNACEFAQCSHLSMMLRAGVLTEQEMLTLQGDIPRGILGVGVIIDDLVLLEKLLWSKLGDQHQVTARTLADDRLDLALKAYAEHKLEVNLKKEFRNQLKARFWGVDGKKGILRGSSLRLWPLIVVTARVAMLGLSSVSLLEAIAGSWVSLFSIRRRFLSAMNFIFEAIAIPQQAAIIRLSTDMVSELWSLVLLGPLAAANLRAQYTPFITATDASNHWLAAVRASVPQSIVSEAARRGLRKGRWSKLLPPHKAWRRAAGVLDETEELPEDCFDARPLWVTLARCVEYTERWRKRVEKSTHINVLELRAHLLEERRLAQEYTHRRFLYGLDSQVTLGSVVKGRAASRALNRELIKSIPHIVGSDIYSSYMYFPSAVNRADGPTRDTHPAEPDVPLPDWWEDASNGDYRGLDQWIDDNELRVDFKDFCCADLLTPVRPDDRPQRRLPPRQRQQLGRTDCRAFDDPQCCELSAEALELLNSFPTKQFMLPKHFTGFLGPGVLDLFSGCFGVAKALVRNGAPWVLCYEWNRGSSEDLLDEGIRNKIIKLIKAGAVKCWGAAPICGSFSVAVTPPVRSNQYPRGLPGISPAMKKKVRDGNSHCDFAMDLVDLSESCDSQVLYWIENPDTSWFWRQHRCSKYRSPTSPLTFRCCFCRFGTAWKKPTRFGTNIQGLAGLRLMCLCKKNHLQLRGSSPYGKAWTKVAEPYPRHLNDLLAKAMCIAAGWIKQSRLDVAGCSKTGSLRPGEATVPGPRPRPKPREHDLDSVQLRSTTTLLRESQALEMFMNWSRDFLTCVQPEHLYPRIPEFLAAALCTYGRRQYNKGGALSSFRHLLLCCRRWVPPLRGLSLPCWDLVAKWELMEPVCHRVPVPEGLLQAFVVIAWQLKWYSWVGVTLIAYYGAGRVGEVLRCLRRDLVFPQDILDRDFGGIFLQLKQFKALGRQPARIQHMEIRDETAVRILTAVYAHVPKDTPLYGASPSAYRRRWDAVLRICQVPSQLRLTPGGLRGGAAVMHYRKHTPINDILWRLRLRSQTTLESYLQETAASAIFVSLDPKVRELLFSIASLFGLLVPLQPGAYSKPC